MVARRCSALALLLGLALVPCAAGAQTASIRGSVFSDSVGHVVGGAEVALPALDRRTATNERGAFQFNDLPAGQYLLVVRRVGFAPWQDSVALVAGQVATRTIVLHPQAAVLDSVQVTGSRPTYISPQLRRFDERSRQGFGHFITEDQLREQEGRSLGRVIDRYIPGLEHVYADGSAIYIASGRKASAGGEFLHKSEKREMCWVSVYIDGVLVYDERKTIGRKPPDFSHMDTGAYAGVEFYAGGATMPPQFNVTGSGCGTLLLWTRER